MIYIVKTKLGLKSLTVCIKLVLEKNDDIGNEIKV